MYGRAINLIENEEHRILRDTVRKFVEAKVEPIAAKIDSEDLFPRALFEELGSYAFTGIMVSDEYGGLGHDVITALIVLEEISKSSPALALSLLAHSILCGHNIDRWGSDSLKTKYLTGITAGSTIGGMAITEPDAGSDVYSIKTTALKRKDKYILNGSKIFITNAEIADLLVVYAITGEGKPSESMSSFVVEMGWSGVTVTKSFEKLGMRGSPTGVVYFDSVEIPESNLLGKENNGFYQLMKSFEIERITISAQGIGIAQRSLEWMLNHSIERKQFGKSLAEFEMIQEKIARVSGLIDMVRTYLYFIASKYDAEEDLRFEAATVKYFSSKLAVDASLEAIQVLGGYGYTKEYPVERLMRDAKLLEIGAGTTEIMSLIMARDVIKKHSEGLVK